MAAEPVGRDGDSVLSPSVLESWRSELATVATGEVDLAGLSSARLVDLVRAAEALKSAACAAQARLSVAFADAQEAEQRAAGVPEDKVGAGISAQVALARGESPYRGSRLLGLARALTAELPETLAALARGETSEWRATLVARETACLDPAARGVVDGRIAPKLRGAGDRQVEGMARRLAYEVDAVAVVERARRAPEERRVTLRPAPDTMTLLSALLPMTDGVAVLAALDRAADTARAGGDSRTRGQVMADALVARITGSDAADPTGGTGVEIQLVMSPETLFGTGEGADATALVHGYGPIPAGLARDLVRNSRARVWVRRLFTNSTGGLVSMDSRRRLFDGNLRRLLVARDQTCRTPWCDAPIRHADHVRPVRDGGRTTAENGQGLCEACNYAKQAPGWHNRADGAGSLVVITTPTGHRYTTTPPSLPGSTHRPPGRDRASPDPPSLLERFCLRLLGDWAS